MFFIEGLNSLGSTPCLFANAIALIKLLKPFLSLAKCLANAKSLVKFSQRWAVVDATCRRERKNDGDADDTLH